MHFSFLRSFKQQSGAWLSKGPGRPGPGFGAVSGLTIKFFPGRVARPVAKPWLGADWQNQDLNENWKLVLR